MKVKLFALSLAGAMASMSSAYAATEVTLWHSMEGALGDRVNELVEGFNGSQTEYKVNAVYKGTYGESMNAGIAAFRAGNAPDILQVFEVGTATMMHARGAIKPVQEMSEEVGYYGDIDLIPAYTFQSGNFKYYNFIGVVQHEFEVDRSDLNWEVSKVKWVNFNELIDLDNKHFWTTGIIG